MLLIPESRKRPITESLLYKQIVRFLYDEKIEAKFDIVFISIADGVVEIGSRCQVLGSSKNVNNLKAKTYNLKPNAKLPPERFRSGRSWISKEVKQEMAKAIAEYIKENGAKYDNIVAYVRGSYLDATRISREMLGIEIEEIFTEDELAKLKKQGIRWMKVGLRMPEAFTIFQKRIVEFAKKSKISG